MWKKYLMMVIGWPYCWDDKVLLGMACDPTEPLHLEFCCYTLFDNCFVQRDMFLMSATQHSTAWHGNDTWPHDAAYLLLDLCGPQHISEGLTLTYHNKCLSLIWCWCPACWLVHHDLDCYYLWNQHELTSPLYDGRILKLPYTLISMHEHSFFSTHSWGYRINDDIYNVKLGTHLWQLSIYQERCIVAYSWPMKQYLAHTWCLFEMFLIKAKWCYLCLTTLQCMNIWHTVCQYYWIIPFTEAQQCSLLPHEDHEAHSTVHETICTDLVVSQAHQPSCYDWLHSYSRHYPTLLQSTILPYCLLAQASLC